MVDADSMAINQSSNDLAEYVNDVDFDKTALLMDVAEQLSTLDLLHDEVAAAD